METIVSAALMRDGLIYSLPAPARHGHIMGHVDDNHDVSYDPFLPDEQGFLTSKGRFVDRNEAAEIAMNSGQIATPQWGRQLYSEDLW